MPIQSALASARITFSESRRRELGSWRAVRRRQAILGESIFYAAVALELRCCNGMGRSLAISTTRQQGRCDAVQTANPRRNTTSPLPDHNWCEGDAR